MIRKGKTVYLNRSKPRGKKIKYSVRLSDLNKGESGVIARLNMQSEKAQKLMRLGITPGARVKVIRFAPFHGPVQIEVRGTFLAVRLADAARIQLDLKEYK